MSQDRAPGKAVELPPLPGSDDTIAALATAPGHTALAVIRLSGPNAFVVAKQVIDPWPATPRQTTLGQIIDPRSGALLDRAIVVRYDAPRSYTGEDMVEITSHGGHLVPATILAALIGAGARLASAGENSLLFQPSR